MVVTSRKAIIALATNSEVVEDSQYLLHLYCQITLENWSDQQKESPVIPSPTAGLSKILFKGTVIGFDAFLFRS